ncbi:MAG: FkbM family methyltransferase [Candidatus Sumerlaeaceae bacterium]|nr:FkbM family methyltransferase [Candidatus Sumerlaeaceae bacterium]
MELPESANTIFQKLWDDTKQGVHCEKTSALDIFHAYRLLLNRLPEDSSIENLRQRAAEFPTLQALLFGFTASREFRSRYYGHSNRPDGHMVIVRDGDLRFSVNLHDLVIGWSIINGVYELTTRRIVESLVQPGWRCLDIGANLGYFSAILGRACGSTGRVFSFEPHPALFGMLETTIGESGLGATVTASQCACSDASGTITLLHAADTNNWGGSFVFAGPVDETGGLQTTQVPMTALDDSPVSTESIDFVKMDIEGGEYHTLQGMTKLVARCKPIMVLEVFEAGLNRRGIGQRELFGLLGEWEYDLLAISENPESERIGVSALETDLGPYEGNVLCVPKGRQEQVLSRLG